MPYHPFNPTYPPPPYTASASQSTLPESCTNQSSSNPTHILTPSALSSAESPWQPSSTTSPGRPEAERESGRPTDEVYKSFKSFTSLENQSRSQRGEQALCTPAAREKAFRKLLRLSRDEEERKWEIDEGVWDEATEERQLNGEFGWYVGFDEKKFDDALEAQEEENLGGGEGGGGGMAEGGGVGLGMGWETDLVEVEEERVVRKMRLETERGERIKGKI